MLFWGKQLVSISSSELPSEFILSRPATVLRKQWNDGKIQKHYIEMEWGGGAMSFETFPKNFGFGKGWLHYQL